MIEVGRLLWDEWSVAHIARHKVLPDEVEEVCPANPLVLNSYGGRYVVANRIPHVRPGNSPLAAR